MAKRRDIVDALNDQATGLAASRLAAAQATIRALRRQIKEAQQAHGDALNFNDDLAAALTALPALKPPTRRKVPAKGADVAMCYCLGDWHIGEVVDATEMEGFNAYNLAIARRRLEFLVEKSLTWLEIARKGYRVNRCHVLVVGDMIQGDIRDEFIATNEFPVPEQAAKAGRLLADVLSALCMAFGEVTADLIGADNHGRLTRKPQSKEAARNNFNYLVYHIAAAMLSQQKNLRLQYHLPLKAQVDIEGQSVLVEHGHSTRSWMGIPFYGLERASGREARKRLSKGRPYQLHIVGHWHIPGELPGLMLNGSLVGANEYDSLAGRYAEPSQTTFLMHSKHGMFNRIPWRLGEDAERDT
ncbi:MAG TPA: hypothetical protein VMY35_01770 [Phycisphaerae bacterium]|nr:hypothetical protein [Phycisphaerae bacterium]